MAGLEDIQKRIADIEKEISTTPYHKGTEHYHALLRSRLVKLKDQQVEKISSKSGGGGGYGIKKHGDATVVLVGYPSVGKSTLLNKLTNAQSPTAEYAFTTVSVIPGMMKYKGASIQILDVPGLIEGAAEGKGRGREVLSVIRGADLLLLMAEAGKEEQFGKILAELYKNGVRINTDEPKVKVVKKIKGGMKVNSTTKQDLDRSTVIEVAREFGVINAEVTLMENLTIERLIDVFARNRIYTKGLFAITKADRMARNSLGAKLNHIPGGFLKLKISADTGLGLDELRAAIWERLGLTCVYLKEPGGETDYFDPLIMREGQTLDDVMQKIGKDFAEGVKEVKIWGKGARFEGQKVSLSTPVQDEMEVMFVK